VKLIKSGRGQYQFQLASREKDLLLQILDLYPRIPAGHQRLTKGVAKDDSNQQLLSDFLAETRSQNRQKLQTLLSDPRRLHHADNEWRLVLSSEDVEWVLQMLNDVRIGSWIELGSPETPAAALKAETAPIFWAMEMAGFFQMRFLELLGS
jgi:hypothetical protein